MHPAASVATAPDTDHLPAYRLFHDAVVRAQLQSWLPQARHLIVDLSGPHSPAAELAALAGHKVLRVIDNTTASEEGSGKSQGESGSGRGAVPPEPKGADADWTLLSPPSPPQERGTSDEGRRRLKGRPEARGTTLLVADSSRLSFLSDRCADDVIADDRALSTHLAAEAMIAEIARVLRPAGRVLACVDSLVLGMAALADQHRWAHLVDLPHADVVLVPWPDGTITRCYGPDQARELFTGAGLAVDWIRPRTVFSESMVAQVFRRNPASLPKLVRAELTARSDESLGAQLVIAASKR